MIATATIATITTAVRADQVVRATSVRVREDAPWGEVRTARVLSDGWIRLSFTDASTCDLLPSDLVEVRA